MVTKMAGENLIETLPIFLPYEKCVSRENSRELFRAFSIFPAAENFVAEFSIAVEKREDWLVGSFVRKPRRDTQKELKGRNIPW